MKLKRIGTVLLALCLCVSLMALTASAATVASGSCGTELTWVLSDDGILTISGTGAMKSYSSVNDTPWYDYADQITKLVVKSGVTTISKNAFREFAELKTVSFPSTLTSIGTSAFRECDALTAAKIPANTTVGDYAFYKCAVLQNVSVPDIDKLGNNSFGSCPKLKTAGPVDGSYNVKFGVNETSMWPNSFKWCSSLTHITLPEGLTTLEEGSLSGLKVLTGIVLPDSLTVIGDHALYGCTSLVDVNIPNGVESIMAGAFKQCTSLVSIEIPDSVTHLDNSVFEDCKNLTDVTLSENITYIQFSCFSGCSSLKNIQIPEGVTKIGQNAFTNCTSLVDLDLPEGLEAIEDSVFAGCRSLVNVIIPDSVSSIGENAFSGCSSLVGVVVSENVSRIQGAPFTGLSDSCKIIFLGDAPVLDGPFAEAVGTAYYSVNAIGWDTVANGTHKNAINWVPCIDVGTCGADVAWALTETGELVILGKGDMKNYTKESSVPWYEYRQWIDSVTIHEGVTSVGTNAFYFCKDLTSASLPNSVTTIMDMAFYNTPSLKQITIPKGVRTIMSSAFCNGGLERITFKNGIQSIGSAAFMRCPLETVSLPASVQTIAPTAFLECNHLKSFSVNANSKYFTAENGVLYTKDMTSLVKVPAAMESRQFVIPNSVRTVGSYALENCPFNEIIISEGVTAIQNNAFENCDSIHKIVIPDSVTYLGTSAFHECSWLEMAVIGSGVAEIGKAVFSDSFALERVYFTGNAPATLYTYVSGEMECTLAFDSCNTDIYYPKRDYTWTTSKRNSIGYGRTWKTYTGAKILTQPVTQKVKSGTTTRFSVEAYGAQLSYQWQYKKTADGEWINSTLTGNKTDTLTVKATTSRDSFYYRCVMTDKYGTQTVSGTARLYALGIKTQPTHQKVKAGTATFKITATGAGKTYQWQYKTSSDGTWKNCSFEGSQSAAMNVDATTGNHGYYFRCVVKDNAGNKVTSNTVRLYVLGIKTQPTSQKLKSGSTATFKVSATGADKTYQWQYKTSSDGTWKNCSFEGNQSATMKVKATTGNHGYYFRCLVRDNAGNRIATKTVRLYVLGIKTQPASQTAAAGTTAKFTISATGADRTYQWQYRTSKTGTWKTSPFTGSTSATMKLSATKARSGYQFRCIVKDSAGNSVTSSYATLTVK